MNRSYSDCYVCGGSVEERRLSREIWWKGKLYIIEDVPIGVCVQCGEKVIHASVAKAIDRILASEAEPEKTVEVPVYAYA